MNAMHQPPAVGGSPASPLPTAQTPVLPAGHSVAGRASHPAAAPEVEAAALAMALHQTPSTTQAAAAAPTTDRKPWLWVLLVLVVGGAAAWYTLGEKHEAPAERHATAAAAGPAGSFALNANEIRSLRIETMQERAFRAERLAEGRIAYNDDRSTPVLSPYTGRVTRAFARVGDSVAAGDPLFEIETPDVTSAANDLLSALDTVNKNRSTLEQAQREETRQGNLFAARAASQRDVEQARTAAANAGADLRSAEAQLMAARDKLRVLGRSAEQIAEIERTRQVSGVVTVRAPLAGTVVQRRVGPGQWLAAGQGDPVFTIADLSTMWLVAAVREVDVPLVRVGQDVEVTVGALPDRYFAARIVRMNAGLDAATRRLTVQAEVQDPDHLLKPEMYATFRISVGEESRGVAVPVGAVIFRGSEASVWVALDEGRFALRRIRPGIRDGEQIEVVEGLRAGDRVVTGGALFIDRAARVD